MYHTIQVNSITERVRGPQSRNEAPKKGRKVLARSSGFQLTNKRLMISRIHPLSNCASLGNEISLAWNALPRWHAKLAIDLQIPVIKLSVCVRVSTQNKKSDCLYNFIIMIMTMIMIIIIIEVQF